MRGMLLSTLRDPYVHAFYYQQGYWACSSRVLVRLSLGSTAFPLFGWGVHIQELLHTAVVHSISTALPLFVMLFSTPPAPHAHACGVGTAVWYLYSFVLECSLRGACSSCVLEWLSPSGDVGTVLVWYGTWCGTVWHGVWRGTVCDIVCWYKALRFAGGLRRPLRSLRKKKYINITRSGQRPMIDSVVFFCDCSCKLAT